MAYKPCTVTTNTGTTTYHQQLALQQLEINAMITPRKTFTKDLLQWMKTLHKKGILGNLTYTPFSTTKAGKNCIYYILIYHEIVTGVKKMGYYTFDQLLYTDHRCMFLDLDTALLFDAEHAKLVQKNSCIL
eukprot:12811293-Ditylum_brightwellii.AAC.1